MIMTKAGRPGRRPKAEDLVDWYCRWDAVGPAAVAEALSSKYNPLVDDDRLITRPHAEAWLADHVCRTKARERRAAWATRLMLALAVIGAIAAVISAVAATIAAVPVVQEWLK
jgi:hypothetical protein